MARTLSLSKELEELYCFNAALSDDMSTNGEQLKRVGYNMKMAMQNILTDKQCRCMIMYYFDAKQEKDIARELGISCSTVSRHLKAGREKMRVLKTLVF